MTRSCTNPAPNGGAACAGWNVEPCNPEACRNCTVTQLSWYSACTKPCGTGTTWRARTVTQYPGPGGTPCPQLNFTYECNTYLCMETMRGRGYWFWGPIKGPGPLSYIFRRIDANFDVFLFDQANFFQYQYDASRTKPYGTNYQPLRSSLNVENTAVTVALLTTTDYYLVVDHTLIGAAKGTDNGDGTTSFNEMRFQYDIDGVDPGPGYSTDGTSMLEAGGIAGVGAGTAIAPAFALIAALIVAVVATR